MAEITEEIVYHVKIDIAELNILNNDESLYILVGDHQIVLSKQRDD